MADPTEDARPSPDALLELAKKEQTGRGKLKIFLGAAPGVGKTYEMLLSAHAQKAAGVDVVVGVVETHGRPETEALLKGLEILPKKKIPYHGRELEEMDLEALLTRRPQLALVDELAHTNAFGSRHHKRYFDVQELLEAGIDVYTTLNVQHLESLNDVVAQITTVRVRETVPDAVLDEADEVEMVDITPRELIQRLKEGKVYVPKQAERALMHFFSHGNLTALRELALRRTAQSVDEQLLTHMQAHAISGPWPAGERIVVCVSEDPRAAGLVRYAKRLADRLRAPWTALYIETTRTQALSVEDRDRIADTLRLAERLGGRSETIPGAGNVAADVLAYARAQNVTLIIVGKSTRSRLFEMVHGSVVRDLLKSSKNISVHVISGEEVLPGLPKKSVQTKTQRDPARLGLSYGAAALASALAAAVAWASQAAFSDTTVPLIFLLAVTLVAYMFGLGPSLLAALVSMLLFNFFFLPPLFSFTIADPANVGALVLFFAAAVLVSELTARLRLAAHTARRRASMTSALYVFAKNLASLASIDDLAWAAVSQIAQSLQASAVLLIPDKHGALEVLSTYPVGEQLDEADMSTASWCFDKGKPAGRGADTLPGAARLFLPLRTSRGVMGVIGLGRGLRADIILTPEERRLLDALMDQAAVAIERVRFASQMDEARLAAETERLRGALLTSLSHDLKTPLASILGAATSLKEYHTLMDENARQELVATIQEEAERMSRFIANLLDMARLEAGAIDIQREPTDIPEVIGAAVGRLGRLLSGHKIELHVEPDLPLLNLDALILEQALSNLLDNARKYAPQGSTISVAARRQGRSVVIEVMDEGPGIPEQDIDLIFEKFYRVRHIDRQRAGTGLGLSICRGFVEALGGTVRAANRQGRSGAIFIIELPVAESSVPRRNLQTA